jgi:hypothetical protein
LKRAACGFSYRTHLIEKARTVSRGELGASALAFLVSSSAEELEHFEDPRSCDVRFHAVAFSASNLVVVEIERHNGERREPCHESVLLRLRRLSASELASETTHVVPKSILSGHPLVTSDFSGIFGPRICGGFWDKRTGTVLGHVRSANYAEAKQLPQRARFHVQGPVAMAREAGLTREQFMEAAARNFDSVTEHLASKGL